MPEITLHGPVIREGVHNVILRGAFLHSPVSRSRPAADFYKIKVGVAKGAYTTWVGEVDQSTQKISAGEPLSMLDEGSEELRLMAGQMLVVKAIATGTPETLAGARVNFRMARVGGRHGAVKPLVDTGVDLEDPDSQTAIEAVRRQVNNMAEWQESVALRDPAYLAPVGAFQGRLQRDSATQISLQRYNGNWVDVNGKAVAITSNGLSITTTATLLAATGAVSSTAPSPDTLYYVYLSVDGKLRLCATAPSYYLGSYYLGTTGSAQEWRLCGMIYLSDATEFTDTIIAREVVNYYNRESVEMMVCPEYNNEGAGGTSSYSRTNATWAAVDNTSFVSYLSFGDQAIRASAHGYHYDTDDADNLGSIGIGDGSGTNVVAAGMAVLATNTHTSCSLDYTPSSGRSLLYLSNVVDGGSITYYADYVRNGATADPRATYLTATVEV